MVRRIMIVGGFGFIGSNLARMWLSESPADQVVILDNLGPTSDPRSLAGLESDFVHCNVDLRDAVAVRKAIEQYDPVGVINCATSYHYEEFPPINRDFYEIDILGTLNVLDALRGLPEPKDVPGFSSRRYLQVSTDEVFGTLGEDDEPFSVADRPDPRTSYGTVKATADQMVLSHFEAYRMDVVVTHASRTFGPHQRADNLIPYSIHCALANRSIHVPDASMLRDWIYVDDHCWGIMQAFELGRAGARYCFAGNAERTNGEVVEETLAIYERLIQQFNCDIVTRRAPGLHLTDEVHPNRRSLQSAVAEIEFGWKPDFPFEMALETTVAWYLNRFLGLPSLS